MSEHIIKDSDKTDPAIGVSIIANVGSSAQITLQTFFGRETPDAEANALIDRLMSFSSRQKAAAEIPDLEAELDKHERSLAQFDEDKARLDAEFERDQAVRQVQVEELTAHRTKLHDTAYENHVKTGRSAEFEVKGHIKANISRCDQEIVRIKAAMQKAVAERDLALQNLGTSRTRFVTEIEAIKNKLETRRRLVG